MDASYRKLAEGDTWGAIRVIFRLGQSVVVAKREMNK